MNEARARDIMTREVFTVTPEMTVRDFARFLLEHRISGAPVLDSAGGLVGIATEADLIVRDARLHLPTVVTLFDSVIYLESPRRFQQELQKIIGGKVADIMTPHPVTITPEASLQEMATQMHDRQRHLLPVLEDGRLVGIVGKADLVRAIAQEDAP